MLGKQYKFERHENNSQWSQDEMFTCWMSDQLCRSKTADHCLSVSNSYITCMCAVVTAVLVSAFIVCLSDNSAWELVPSHTSLWGTSITQHWDNYGFFISTSQSRKCVCVCVHVFVHSICYHSSVRHERACFLCSHSVLECIAARQSFYEEMSACVHNVTTLCSSQTLCAYESVSLFHFLLHSLYQGIGMKKEHA